jgi:ABC-2 type transport system permease protein
VIGVELTKMARRPRTWVSIVLLCGLPVLVAVFVAVTHIVPPPGQGPTLLSAVLSNGALYPAAALAIVLPIFLPVAVAVMAGDSIAGEAGSGMLRYLLARPVGRTRLLAAKLIALVVYTLFSVVAVAVTAYITGRILFGQQPVAVTTGGGLSSGNIAAHVAATSLSGTALTPADILIRTAGTIAFIGVSMLGVGAIAMFLSTLTDSPLAAALGALAALVTSEARSTPTCPPGTGWPGSTSSASRSCGATSTAGSRSRPPTWWCCWARPGPTSPPRTSPAEAGPVGGHPRQPPAVRRGRQRMWARGAGPGRSPAARSR